MSYITVDKHFSISSIVLVITAGIMLLYNQLSILPYFLNILIPIWWKISYFFIKLGEKKLGDYSDSFSNKKKCVESVHDLKTNRKYENKSKTSEIVGI